MWWVVACVRLDLGEHKRNVEGNTQRDRKRGPFDFQHDRSS
jgi:hypothetical protein